ncbi:MAG: fasciclin domain-containing protein [Planctomycetota bacterium]
MQILLPLGALFAGAAMTFAAPASTPAAPAPTKGDIVDVAANAGSFSTLLAAAEAAGLVDALKSEGPLTVLAPTDDAFAKLGSDTIADLLRPENKETLARILTYHVISGAVDSSAALQARSAPTLAGPEVSFALTNGRLTVNGSVNVVANDVKASNGVIHVIDTVLIPPAPQPEGRLVVGFFSDPPGEELANYLGVDRHKCLLVSRITRGSEAEAAGLRAFDLIFSIDGQPATSSEVKNAKERVGFGGTLGFEVLRRGESIHIDTKVGVERH